MAGRACPPHRQLLPEVELRRTGVVDAVVVVVPGEGVGGMRKEEQEPSPMMMMQVVVVSAGPVGVTSQQGCHTPDPTKEGTVSGQRPSGVRWVLEGAVLGSAGVEACRGKGVVVGIAAGVAPCRLEVPDSSPCPLPGRLSHRISPRGIPRAFSVAQGPAVHERTVRSCPGWVVHLVVGTVVADHIDPSVAHGQLAQPPAVALADTVGSDTHHTAATQGFAGPGTRCSWCLVAGELAGGLGAGRSGNCAD